VTRPRIVIGTIAAGGGHVATARAMAEAIEADSPGAYRVDVTEPMLDVGFAAFDARHKAQWKRMLAAPWTARVGQRLIDAFPAVTRAALRAGLDALARALAAAYAPEPPALIVVNHGFLAFAFGRARVRYGLRAPLRVFATEPVDASALWAAPEAGRFVAPSRSAARDLVRLGVPAEAIDVLGYPVGRAFLTPPTRAEARFRLRLAERFTALVSLGAEGVGGRVPAVIAALRSLPEPPQVVVVAGRNAALAESLRAQAQMGVIVRGVVSDMASELAACDVFVGKCGPASVMEAIAVARPVLITAVAGLNEVALLRFVVTGGFGHDARRLADLPGLIARYQASPAAAEAVAARSRALDLPAMAARLAAYLIAAAGGVPRGDPTPGVGLA
jgi:UDP-N-acetylglucosamine:LPS N-acetylglucosamine transferase